MGKHTKEWYNAVMSTTAGMRDVTLANLTTQLSNLPAEGTKFDADKTDFTLVPTKALEMESLVWAHGMRKYGKGNWRKGLKVSRILAASLRHLYAILRGEDLDPETGLPHAAHVRCNMGMLIEFMDRKDLDDRTKEIV